MEARGFVFGHGVATSFPWIGINPKTRERRQHCYYGSSSELVTAPVRAGQALEETTALMSVSVTRDGGTAWAWRLSEGSGLCQGSQLESSGVSTSSSRHPETRE